MSIDRLALRSCGAAQDSSPRRQSWGYEVGYGAFSVSHSNIPEVERYIANQEEHHRRLSFQEELLAFLRKHEIQFDERYLWE